MQLYPSFSSVGAKKIYILNDLYVGQEYRNKGVGRLLINAAKSYAQDDKQAGQSKGEAKEVY